MTKNTRTPPDWRKALKLYREGQVTVDLAELRRCLVHYKSLPEVQCELLVEAIAIRTLTGSKAKKKKRSSQELRTLARLVERIYTDYLFLSDASQFKDVVFESRCAFGGGMAGMVRQSCAQLRTYGK